MLDCPLPSAAVAMGWSTWLPCGHSGAKAELFPPLAWRECNGSLEERPGVERTACLRYGFLTQGALHPLVVGGERQVWLAGVQAVLGSHGANCSPSGAISLIHKHPPGSLLMSPMQPAIEGESCECLPCRPPWAAKEAKVASAPKLSPGWQRRLCLNLV